MFSVVSVCIECRSITEEHIIVFIFGHCLTEHFGLHARSYSSITASSIDGTNFSPVKLVHTPAAMPDAVDVP